MESIGKLPVVDTQPGMDQIAEDGRDEKDRKKNQNGGDTREHSSDCCGGESCFYHTDPCPCWHPSDILCCAVCNDICSGVSNFFASCCSEVWSVLTCGECCGACSGDGCCTCSGCEGDYSGGDCGDCSGGDCDCDCGTC